jgi:hypothetical protein
MMQGPFLSLALQVLAVEWAHHLLAKVSIEGKQGQRNAVKETLQ